MHAAFMPQMHVTTIKALRKKSTVYIQYGGLLNAPLAIAGRIPVTHDSFTRQLQVPVRARLNGHPVVSGLPVPTDDLVPIAGRPS